MNRLWVGCLVGFLIVGRLNSQEQGCNDPQAMAAESEAASLKSWAALYASFKKFAPCDDGAIGEGYSESVTTLLTQKWETINELQELSESNSSFLLFVLWHIDATADSQTLKKILANASGPCPVSNHDFCIDLKKAAEQALLEEGEKGGRVGFRSMSSHQGEVTYSAGQGGFEMKWVISDSGASRGEVVCYLSRETPLQDQISMMERFLAEMEKDALRFNSFHLLSLGRLEQSPDLSFRLAEKAFQSPLWDRKSGRPKKGSENKTVLDIVKQGAIFNELQSLFETHNKTIELDGVEKVLIQPAKKMPFFNELKKLGAKESDQLPFDFMSSFSVKTRGE